MRTHNWRRARGFTLLEMLVVILVIAILIAVALPAFLGQTAKAQDSAARQSVAVSYREGKTIWIGNADTTGYPIIDAVQEGLLSQLAKTEPSLSFGYDVSASNSSQVSVTRLNEDAVIYSAKSGSGTTFCLEDIESATGAPNARVSPGLYWSAGTGSDPCGSGAAWGTPWTGAAPNSTPDPTQAPATGFYPLPEYYAAMNQTGGPSQQANVSAAYAANPIIPIEDAASPNILTLSSISETGLTAAAPNTIVYQQAVVSGTGAPCGASAVTGPSQGGEICESTTAGATPTLLVSNSGGPASDPTFTPDRKEVLYIQGGNIWETQASCPTAPSTLCADHRISASDGVETQPNAATSQSSGKLEVAYVADGRIEVWTEGVGATQIGNSTNVASEPRLSPDGSEVAYVTTDPSGVSQLRVANVDGSNDHAITNDALQYSDLAPVWNPGVPGMVQYLQESLLSGKFAYAEVSAAGGGTPGTLFSFVGSYNGTDFAPGDLSLANGGTTALYSGTDSSGNPGVFESTTTGNGGVSQVVSASTNYAFTAPAG